MHITCMPCYMDCWVHLLTISKLFVSIYAMYLTDGYWYFVLNFARVLVNWELCVVLFCPWSILLSNQTSVVIFTITPLITGLCLVLLPLIIEMHSHFHYNLSWSKYKVDLQIYWSYCSWQSLHCQKLLKEGWIQESHLWFSVHLDLHQIL